jgi:hypothetical protein
MARLNYIITDKIASFINMNCTIDDYLATEFDTAIRVEYERIIAAWDKTIFNFGAESDRYGYVRLHQHELIQLAGALDEIDFGKFTNSANVEFHGCQTCRGDGDNFGSKFSLLSS